MSRHFCIIFKINVLQCVILWIIIRKQFGDVHMETMQEYVVRKLNERSINLVAVSSELKMNRSKIYRIKNGGETKFSTLQKLNDYFKKAGE